MRPSAIVDYQDESVAVIRHDARSWADRQGQLL